MTARQIKTSQRVHVCVWFICVCVNEVQVWVISQSQVWGMMGNGVRMEMANIQAMVPSGGAEEEVWEPPL